MTLPEVLTDTQKHAALRWCGVAPGVYAMDVTRRADVSAWLLEVEGYVMCPVHGTETASIATYLVPDDVLAEVS